jgi:CubicO group peptidase (beta-lactamase class C family)
MDATTRPPSAAADRRPHRSPLARRLPAALLAAWLLTTLAAAPALAVEDTDPPSSPAASQLDLDAIGSFVDAAVADALAEHEAPGGVVVLVADGRIVLAEGYGRTALDGGEPVDPARTRFDVGSVAKLLTATAVMQQVERGTIDLDADVNGYLDAVEIPATYPEPVTPAHLLTHTAGFAERFLVGMWADGPGESEPLAETLARHLPERIRPPGVAHQYSNYGMSLAGHLVEAVTGEDFETNVQASILTPLGMTRTSYGTPVADAMDAVPHSSMAGPTAALEPAYVNWLPAGGLWTTGEDMAAFMLAHLQGGAHDGQRILEPETVEAMHRTQFSPHPDVPGLGYGFFGDAAGAVQHGGGWMGTGAHLYLRPDLGIGLFSAFNHDEGPLIATRVHREIIDRFLPDAPVDAPTDADADAADADADGAVSHVAAPGASGGSDGAYAGRYRWNRHDRSTFASVFSTVQISRLEVTEHGDGTLTTTMSPAAFLEDTRWVPTGPGVFVEEGGTNTLAFDLDDDGRAVGLHVMGAQLFSMERMTGVAASGADLGLLLATSALLLVAAIAWPATALVRRLRGRGGDTPPELRRVRRISGLAAGLGVAFVLGLVVHFATDMGGLLQISAALRGLLWLPLLTALLTAGLAALVGVLWWRRVGSLSARLYHSAVLVTLLAFLPVLHAFNLLGFHH